MSVLFTLACDLVLILLIAQLQFDLEPYVLSFINEVAEAKSLCHLRVEALKLADLVTVLLVDIFRMKDLFAWFPFYHCATRLAVAIEQFCSESCILLGYSTGQITIRIIHVYSESQIKVVVAESEPAMAQNLTLFSRERPRV